jgi:serine/threonine protein kinase
MSTRGYVVRETLGSGSFGVVKRATHPQHGTVALKFIQSEKLKKRELCVLSALEHPSIVKVLDIFEEVLFVIIRYSRQVTLPRRTTLLLSWNT